MQTRHRVLMVGEDSVILFRPEQGGLARSAAIPRAAADFETRLAAALKREGAEYPLLVLGNDGDPTYRKEENLSAADHRARLDEVFKGFPTRTALEVGQPDGDKRNWLFIGVPQSKHLARLGRALAGIPIAGYGLLPIEATDLSPMLAGKLHEGGKPARWTLLAGRHETGGVRHIVTRDGVLALTRIVPVVDNAAAAREVQASMSYLRRFGYRDEDGMAMTIVCAEAEKKAYPRDAEPGAAVRCLTPAEALRLAGAAGTEAHAEFADALYAFWMEKAQALRLHVPVVFKAA